MVGPEGGLVGGPPAGSVGMGWTDGVHLGLRGQGVLRVGAIGLPPKEELLLRSVVRVLDAQTERAWEFAEAPPYDVTFTSAGAVAASVSGGLVVRVLPEGVPPGERDEAEDGSITLPIRPFNLRPLLDRLGQRLKTASSASASSAPASSPTSATSASSETSASSPTSATSTTSTTSATSARSATSTPSTGSTTSASTASFGLPRSAEAFVARVRRPGATMFAVVPVGEAPLFIVDPAAGVWSRPAGAGASIRVSDLAARLLNAGVDCVDLEPGDDRLAPGTQGSPQRLEALLWHLGVQATPGEPLRPVASRTTFRLTRWPDFGSIGGNDLVALKLAALLVHRSHRLDQIVTASGAHRDAIVSVLNACALCDLLVAETPAGTAIATSSTASASARAHKQKQTQTNASADADAARRPSASRYSLVLHALRSALGIGRS